MIVSIHR